MFLWVIGRASVYEMSSKCVVTSVDEFMRKLRNAINEQGIAHLRDFSAPMYLPEDFDTLCALIRDKSELPTKTREYSKWCIYDGERNPSVYLLIWPPNSSTEWHGHPLRGCLFYLLNGEMVEQLPDGTSRVYCGSLESPNAPVCVESRHRMLNGEKTSVSLHIYWNDFVGEQ